MFLKFKQTFFEKTRLAWFEFDISYYNGTEEYKGFPQIFIENFFFDFGFFGAQWLDMSKGNIWRKIFKKHVQLLGY